MNNVERELLRLAIAAYREKDAIDQSDTDLIVDLAERLLDETEDAVIMVPCPQEEVDW